MLNKSVKYAVRIIQPKRRNHFSNCASSSATRALNYFDDYYGSIFGIKWAKIREALLKKSNYVAVVNNFGDAVGTSKYLENLGAVNMKSLIKEWKFEGDLITDHPTNIPFQIVTEDSLQFPDSLNVYTHRCPEITTFPFPQQCSAVSSRLSKAKLVLGKQKEVSRLSKDTSPTGVLNYYPLNGASVMCILVLGLTREDRVLDLCAAPGGKALLALQTLLPNLVVANDITRTRSSRISRVFRNYLPEYETNIQWQERAIVTTCDGQTYTSDQEFDKILVDAPCTSDRISVTTQEKNLFSEEREHVRQKLPGIQTALLLNALKLVKVGGEIVYSTCSMSPKQNDQIVIRALQEAQIKYGILASVRDLTRCMLPFQAMYDFHRGRDAALGQLIVPHPKANFGPLYFSKIKRTS